MSERFITSQDVLQRFKISRSSLYRLMREGLPHVNIGRLRFDPEAIDKWILEHKAGGHVDTSKPPKTVKKQPRIRPEINSGLFNDSDHEPEAKGNEFRQAALESIDKIAGRYHLLFKCDDGSEAKPIAKENTPAMKYLQTKPQKGSRVKLRGWLKQGRFVVTDIIPA